MENIIIIAVLLCMIGGIVFYLCGAKKRGETCIGCPYSKQCGSKSGGCEGGGCSGGSGYRPRKKKLSRTIYQKRFGVDGMHCENCKKRVEEIVNDIKEVAGKVNLRKGELTVFYAEKVDDGFFVSRIEKAGYTVTEIN